VQQGFFGGPADDFARYAAAGHQLAANNLVQEVAASPVAALGRVRQVLGFVAGTAGVPAQPAGLDAGTAALLTDIGDAALEVFPAGAPRWRTFLVRSGGRVFGLLTNPPRNPDNLIGVPEVMRALAAVRLFEALGLPLVSAIDSPGGDPRGAASDADLVLRSLELAEALAAYPHPKLGLLLARCYGGIGLFTLPTSHGSRGLYALEGARIGIMGDAIINGMVPPGSRLRAEWEATLALHSPDMREMAETGNVQGTWTRTELRARVAQALWFGVGSGD
jgi:hypothetical protein